MHAQIAFGKTAYRPVDHLKPGRPARNDEERAARRAEIDRRYKQPLKNCSGQRRIAVLRRHDLETLCAASDVPEDGGFDWLDIAANHIAFICCKADAKIAAVLRWRARFTPMIEVGTAMELAERVIADPRMPKADELGHRLGLTDARRTELGITTIGGIDCDKAKRKARRRKRAAARERARRAKTRAAPHAASKAQTKPWIDDGVSRRTYFRRQREKRHAAGTNGTYGTNSCAAHTECVGVSFDTTVKPLAPVCRAPGHPARIGPVCVAIRLPGTERFTIGLPPQLRARMLAVAREITAAANRNIGVCFPRTAVAMRDALAGAVPLGAAAMARAEGGGYATAGA